MMRQIVKGLVLALVVVLAAAATASAETAELRYTGNIATSNGTMTIICSSTTPGSDVWKVTLTRNTNNAGYGAQILSFDDLTDTSAFNFATSWMGLFTENNIRNDAQGITQTFEEVTKSASMYQYRLTSTKRVTAPDLTVYQTGITTTCLYTIKAATADGTQFTCERTITNTSGVELAGSQANDRMRTHTQVYDNNYTGDYLAPYVQVDGVWTQVHKLLDGSDALWELTDNIMHTDANPFWGQAKVLDSDAVAAVGLVPGRTFKLTSNLTSSGTKAVALSGAPVGINIRAAYDAGFGQPATLPAGWTADYPVTLDINITDAANVVVVGEPDETKSTAAVSGSSTGILTANGFNKATVTITLRDAAGLLVSGKGGDLTIVATDTGGDNVYGSTVIETSEGVYTCTIASSTAEAKTVTVTYLEGEPGEVVLLTEPVATFVDVPVAELRYTGDIAGADGVLTITCGDRTGGGDVWELDLTRDTGNARRGAWITRFDDLTDSGGFSYAGVGLYGMFSCNSIRNDGAGITMAFEELYRDTDQYTYKLTSVKPVGASSVTVEYVYTIQAATPAGTELTCTRTLTTSGAGVTSANLDDRMPTEMYLNDNNYADDYLTTYVYQDDAWTSYQLLLDSSEAIWKITDNIENRDGAACWGQGEVMPSAAALALGLAPGRTFKLITGITNPGGEMVLLHPTAGVGLDFRVSYQAGFGQPSPLPSGYGVTLEAAMHTNITDEPIVIVPAGDPDPALSEVSRWPDVLTANGFNTTRVTITLKDDAGLLVSGKASDIHVSATDGGGDNDYGTVTETGTGVYLCTISSSTPEEKTISVSVDLDGGGSVTLDSQPTVTFTPLPVAQLRYTGDIAGADGVLTITCGDRTGAGDVWELDLTRKTANAQRGALITRFDDLTDSGGFNYAGGGGEYGMLSCNNIRNDGAGITMGFEELYRDTDQYTYKLTSVKPVGASSVTVEYVYTIQAATPAGTELTCTRTLTTSGAGVTSADLDDRMPTEMYLNDNDYTDDYLTTYVYQDDAWTSYQLLSDWSEAIWKITDNIVNRDGAACWGQGEVLDSVETQGLDLVVGRTFTLGTDVTNPAGEMVLLHPTAGIGLDFRVCYVTGFGQPSPLPSGYRVTLEAAMHTNITDEPGAGLPELIITASADFPWVYQNTAVTTIDRHKSVLTVNITAGGTVGETYAITVGENGGAVANFQVTQPVAIVAGTPQAVNVFGGRRATTTAAGYTLNVTVTGTPGAQTATVNVPLALRLLADIDGDGSVTAADKLEMNKNLNGLATLPGIGLRELDLTGDGATVNAEDKLVINQVLNGLIVP